MKMRIQWFSGMFFPVKLFCQRKSLMEHRITRPVAASLMAGLLCWVPINDAHAQIVIGGYTFGGTSAGGTTTAAADSTSFQGQAAAVSGFAMGSAVSVANTGPLSAAGSAQEATA